VAGRPSPTRHLSTPGAKRKGNVYVPHQGESIRDVLIIRDTVTEVSGGETAWEYTADTGVVFDLSPDPPVMPGRPVLILRAPLVCACLGPKLYGPKRILPTKRCREACRSGPKLYARQHWGIENREHHVRDVAFREDARKPGPGTSPTPAPQSATLVIGAIRGKGFANIAHARRYHARDDQRILALYGYA
jgi:hypothetical protein